MVRIKIKLNKAIYLGSISKALSIPYPRLGDDVFYYIHFETQKPGREITSLIR